MAKETLIWLYLSLIKNMVSISFDRDEYKRGETAKITYVNAPGDGELYIKGPKGYIDTSAKISGSGVFNWLIPLDAAKGQYAVELWARSHRGKITHDTATINGGAPPTEPPPSGFVDTGKVTPSTIEVDPGTYDVMFKLAGYKDKTITNVVVSEGATKTVSATLEPKGEPPAAPPAAPPEKAYLTINTSPTGALVMANSVSCGTTPVTRCELSPGSYQLTITKSGYKPVERGIGIAAGEMDMGTIILTPIGPPPTKKTVTFKSVPSGASINVVSR